MDQQTTEQICEGVTPLTEQRKWLAVYNIPPPRLNIISPYPTYSQFQLDMRRKVEILKYNSSQQNTKTNDFTKKQKYANLAKGSYANQISQYGIINDPTTLIACALDERIPTSTTACGVPGKPILLQYDPDTPLYNYGNFRLNRDYSRLNNVSNAIYNAYTTNIIEFLNTGYLSIDSDIPSTITPAIYNSTGVLGSLIIGDNSNFITYSFNISTPVSLWFTGCIGTSSFDSDGNQIVKPPLPPGGVSLNIKITRIKLNIYYNDTLISSPFNISFNPIELTCNLSTANSLFYGIQYVGMMNISNIVLKTPPNTIYRFEYVATYTYDNIEVNKYVDFIKTGIYCNLTSAFQSDYIHNCSLSSISPNDFTANSFRQFVLAN